MGKKIQTFELFSTLAASWTANWMSQTDFGKKRSKKNYSSFSHTWTYFTVIYALVAEL
jgi:hypothetical protein